MFLCSVRQSVNFASPLHRHPELHAEDALPASRRSVPNQYQAPGWRKAELSLFVASLVKQMTVRDNGGMSAISAMSVSRHPATSSAHPLPGKAYDVIIVGGGLAGLALAVALRNSGLSLALIEGQPPRPAYTALAEWDARLYAVSPANARFLDAIGIWRHLDLDSPQTRLTPVQQMAVFGDQGGRIDFSAYACGVSELAWIAESSLLQHELWESAKRQGNLQLYCPSRPQALHIDNDAAQLTLEDDQVLQGQLIVAADGANSWTRQAAGIEVNFQPYQQMGVVANFLCSQPHQHTARQWFRRDGILAWLPLSGERISMVWSTPERHAQELLSLPADELCQRVAAAGQQQLGKLELITAPAAFPLRLMRAPHAVAPRLALIGDAAHTIHPLSGHGINLGFQDARVLADVLTHKADFVDSGDLSLLRAYERARSEEVRALQFTTHALQRLFQPELTPLAWLRNTGLNLTNGLPVIKNALTRYALG